MTDLERLFRLLVQTLAAADPARLHRPLILGELQLDVLPYRIARRALGIDSSEDYELLLMRLAGGEEGLARAEPDAVRADLEAESRSGHPDLTLLQKHATASLVLSTERLAYALGPGVESAYAPPRPSAPLPLLLPTEPEEAAPAQEAYRPVRPPPVAHDDDLPLDRVRRTPPPRTSAPIGVSALSTTAETEAAAHCAYCGGTLPVGRAAKFCPHCGQPQGVLRCAECQSEVEPGWRHCVACGSAVVER